jgi:hypothetical protein
MPQFVRVAVYCHCLLLLSLSSSSTSCSDGVRLEAVTTSQDTYRSVMGERRQPIVHEDSWQEYNYGGGDGAARLDDETEHRKAYARAGSLQPPELPIRHAAELSIDG